MFINASCDQEVDTIMIQMADKVEGTNLDNQKLLDDLSVDLLQEFDENEERALDVILEATSRAAPLFPEEGAARGAPKEQNPRVDSMEDYWPRFISVIHVDPGPILKEIRPGEFLLWLRKYKDFVIMSTQRTPTRTSPVSWTPSGPT